MQTQRVTFLADTVTAISQVQSRRCVACSIARCGEVCQPRATRAKHIDPGVVLVETWPPPYEMWWFKSGWSVLQAREQAKVCNTKPAQACRPAECQVTWRLPKIADGAKKDLWKWFGKTEYCISTSLRIHLIDVQRSDEMLKRPDRHQNLSRRKRSHDCDVAIDRPRHWRAEVISVPVVVHACPYKDIALSGGPKV